uniref:hypothetical protein n=1 Tax=Desulfobacter sp. UBA2225 TaxID=1961413 RepID=UPI00257DC125
KPNRTLLIIQRHFDNISKDNNYFLFGAGPGQFTSRAGLIASGNYIRSDKIFKILGLELGYTHIQRLLLSDLWDIVRSSLFANSSSANPWFSILSINAEFGIIFFVILLACYIKLLVRVYWSRSINENEKIFVLTVLVFIFLLSFFENYLEFTQAIFVGLFLIKFIQGNSEIRNERN